MRSLLQLAGDLQELSELAATVALELRDIADTARDAKPAEVFALISQLLADDGGDAAEPAPFEDAPGQPAVSRLHRSINQLKTGDTIHYVRRTRYLTEEEKVEIRQWWLNLHPNPQHLSEEKILAMKRAQARKYGVSTKVVSGVIGALSSQSRSQSQSQSHGSIPTQ